MKKILVALSVLVGLTIAVSTATAATTEISLGGTNSNTLTFAGTGSGGWTLSFTPNPLGGSTTAGTGAWSSIPASTYSINQNGATITGTEVGVTPDWTITQSGALLFSIGSLLSGNLQLLNLSQSGTVGSFNDNLAANLTVTGGSDASLVGNNAILAIAIDFTSGTNLANILAGQTLTGVSISSGELDQAPEPVSMVLVGSGLVLLGGVVRRRRKS